MKAELINTIQVFFILIFLIGILAYTISSIKSYIKTVTYTLIKRLSVKALDYSRFMTISNYLSFEKYDIWRYCVYF
jgi:Na+/pantothenate symporter